MHEFSVVETLVHSIEQEVEKQGGGRVAEVRLRRGSAFSEEALWAAFDHLKTGTILESATVHVETTDHEFTCECGKQHVVQAEDLHGHYFMCDGCQKVTEIDEHGDLELISVSLVS